MANLGENLWRNFDAGKVASIRAGRIDYVSRCQSKVGPKRYAVIQIECRDSIGPSFLESRLLRGPRAVRAQAGKSAQHPGVVALNRANSATRLWPRGQSPGF